MANEIVKPQTHIVGQTRCVRTIDDTCLQGCEDLREVHHDWCGAKLFEDLGLHTWRRTEFPANQIFKPCQWTRGRHRFLAVDRPTNQLHVEIVVKTLRRVIAATVVEP